MIYTIKHTDKSGLQWFSIELKSPKELNSYLNYMHGQYGKVPYKIPLYLPDGSKIIEERPDHNKLTIYYL